MGMELGRLLGRRADFPRNQARAGGQCENRTQHGGRFPGRQEDPGFDPVASLSCLDEMEKPFDMFRGNFRKFAKQSEYRRFPPVGWRTELGEGPGEAINEQAAQFPLRPLFGAGRPVGRGIEVQTLGLGTFFLIGGKCGVEFLLEQPQYRLRRTFSPGQAAGQTFGECRKRCRPAGQTPEQVRSFRRGQPAAQVLERLSRIAFVSGEHQNAGWRRTVPQTIQLTQQRGATGMAIHFFHRFLISFYLSAEFAKTLPISWPASCLDVSTMRTIGKFCLVFLVLPAGIPEAGEAYARAAKYLPAAGAKPLWLEFEIERPLLLPPSLQEWEASIAPDPEPGPEEKFVEDEEKEAAEQEKEEPPTGDGAIKEEPPGNARKSDGEKEAHSPAVSFRLPENGRLVSPWDDEILTFFVDRGTEAGEREARLIFPLTFEPPRPPERSRSRATYRREER